MKEKSPIYHAGLTGLGERSVAPVVRQLRPRFRVLTYGRIVKEPGHDQRVTEASIAGKHIIYTWKHGSHAAVIYAVEAALDTRQNVNADSRVEKKIKKFLVTHTFTNHFSGEW